MQESADTKPWFQADTLLPAQYSNHPVNTNYSQKELGQIAIELAVFSAKGRQMTFTRHVVESRFRAIFILSLWYIRIVIQSTKSQSYYDIAIDVPFRCLSKSKPMYIYISGAELYMITESKLMVTVAIVRIRIIKTHTLRLG